MCWNETYSRVREGQHLSDMFPIQNGLKKRCFIAIAFKLCLDYDIKWVQLNQEGLKLNAMYQHLFYADEIYILGRRLHTRKKNTEASIVAIKYTGLEVNSDKIKYIIMSRDQNKYKDWQ
jgi:hypothetical protein